jgi:outer membrane protein
MEEDLNNQQTPTPEAATTENSQPGVATPQPTADLGTTCSTASSTETQHCRKGNIGMLILCIVMLIGIVVLYILHFTGSSAVAQRIPASAVADTTQGLTVAYVNTDTLMAKYQYAIDLQKKIQSLQAQKTNEYKTKMQKFQSDAQAFQSEYQNYLKTGDQLTLSQQQNKEKILTNTQANLQERQAKLQSLENEYAQQIQLQTMQESEKMTNAVYAFIRDFNEKYLHYDLILSKSFSSSPVLYGKPNLDITNVIVDELNKEYAGLDKEEAKAAKVSAKTDKQDKKIEKLGKK